jgi:hypothetical protein
MTSLSGERKRYRREPGKIRRSIHSFSGLHGGHSDGTINVFCNVGVTTAVVKFHRGDSSCAALPFPQEMVCHALAFSF